MPITNAAAAYEPIYGEMSQYDQVFNLAIDIANVYHPVRNSDLTVRHANVNIYRIA